MSEPTDSKVEVTNTEAPDHQPVKEEEKKVEAPSTQETKNEEAKSTQQYGDEEEEEKKAKLENKSELINKK